MEFVAVDAQFDGNNFQTEIVGPPALKSSQVLFKMHIIRSAYGCHEFKPPDGRLATYMFLTSTPGSVYVLMKV